MKNIAINSKTSKEVESQSEPLHNQESFLSKPFSENLIRQNRKIEPQTSLDYNVIYPSENQQAYYPILEFQGEGGLIINELELIRLAIERDRGSPKKHVTTFYIFSPPGLGKTVMGSYLALSYNCPYQVINCVNSMIDLDLLGSQVLLGDKTMWQDGPIPSIIRAANHTGMGILIINELNALSVNAQMALNPLLDKQEGVVLTQNNNEFVKILPTSHLLIIAGMNPDVLGINDLQASVRDRASAIIEMNYPPVEKEARIIEQITGISPEWAKNFCEVIAECRKAKLMDKTITNAPSTRALIDWVNYSLIWGTMLAFQVTIANRYCAGFSAEEGKILERIATGKGVKKWKIAKIFEPDLIDSTIDIDAFHFPSTQPIEVKRAKPKPKPKSVSKISPKDRKAQKIQQRVKELKLQPLDSFCSSKKSKSSPSSKSK